MWFGLVVRNLGVGLECLGLRAKGGVNGVKWRVDVWFGARERG